MGLYDNYIHSSGTHYISNCGHDENGKYSGGSAGDQTGGEWCLRSWYSRPWDCVLRYPNDNVALKIAELGCAAALNDNVGYDQNQRDSYGTELIAADYDPSKITTKCEADCSSGVIANVKAVGHLMDLGGLQNIDATYTGNMRDSFKKAGFEVLTATQYINGTDYLKPGDILLNDTSHTATNITQGTCVSFEPTETTMTTADIEAVAQDVIAGLYGNGDDRVKALTEAGYDYDEVQAKVNELLNVSSSSQSSVTTAKTEIASSVTAIQSWLNHYYSAGLELDGIYGSKTKAGLVKAWQKEVGGLDVDGTFGSKSKAKAENTLIRKGSTGIIVTIWQAVLVCNVINPNGIDGDFGSGCQSATYQFQKIHGLSQDGIVGVNTWSAAFE